jgi:hypothetical protein
MNPVTLSKFLLGGIAALSACGTASAVTVVSQVIEDAWLFNGSDRYERIMNNTGINPGRWSAVRFDTSILSAQAFTNPAHYTWAHYDFSRDLAYLAKAYPTMKEAAAFHEDFLIEVDGRLVTCPAI